jgi:predicted Zn-dependent protease
VQVSYALNAMLDLKSGDAEGAMRQLSKADPSNPIVRAMLAETYKEMDQPVEAQEFQS